MAAVVAVVAAVATALVALFGPAVQAVAHPATANSATASAVVTIGPREHGRPIPPGFIGLSLEYRAVLSYAGSDPRALNPVFLQLLRNIAPDQSPVLRIGGDSTDWTWWPVPKMQRPPGITYNITPDWLAVARALAEQTGVHYILGINLEADVQAIEVAEAHALLAGIGRAHVAALELGNEPELYSRLSYYVNAKGLGVFGRPASYDFHTFTDEFSSFRRAIGSIPLAGPSSGNYWWLQQLPQFLAAEPSLGVVTVHSYWLNECLQDRELPGYPTVPNLLNPHPPSRLTASLARYASLAHADHVPIRIDEMNSVTCAGRPGVSDAFASALWALNALFEAAGDGIDGVNIHTFPGTANELFSFRRLDGRWIAAVRPEYYGLLMFAQAAPRGAKLLEIVQRHTGQTRVWATIGKDGYTRVVLINDSLTHAASVVVQTPHASGPAKLERLLAHSADSTAGVTIGGQSFQTQTTTGALTGGSSIAALTPSTSPYKTTPPRASSYVIALPAASAALLTIAPRPEPATSRSSASVDDDQLLVKAGQDSASVVGHEHQILDPDAKPAG